MFDLGNTIKKLCEQRGMKLTELASKIDMSYQNLHKTFKRNNIMIHDLLQIAKVLDVHPRIFFSDSETPQVLNDPFPGYGNDDYIKCLEEIREISKENRELNKRIRELEEELLGHSRLSETMIYSHILAEELDNEMDIAFGNISV